MRIPVPESLRERAAEHAGEPPARPRDAATIMLVRDGADGIETYLLRRQSSMAFAPRMHVFPGGGVHDSDRDVVEWIGPPSKEWGERLGCDPDTARALVVAAVRETFEESAILLAGPDAHTVVDDTRAQEWQDARLALESGALSFGDFLGSRGLALRADLVGAWSHWITPDFEPRRYDTRFLVAAVPPGQVVGSIPGEADRAHWVPVRRVLAAVEAGTAAMLPPTWITCREVADLGADDVLAAAAQRTIRPIQPRLVEVDGELFLENPLDAEETR